MIKKVLLSLTALLASQAALAQEAVTQAAVGGGIGDKALYALGAGLVLGLAAFGGTMAQGRVGASAVDGVARNPQAAGNMLTPMILSLALIESLVVLSFLIAFFLLGYIKG